jgi:hypothetical protein
MLIAETLRATVNSPLLHIFSANERNTTTTGDLDSTHFQKYNVRFSFQISRTIHNVVVHRIAPQIHMY